MEFFSYILNFSGRLQSIQERREGWRGSRQRVWKSPEDCRECHQQLAKVMEYKNNWIIIFRRYIFSENPSFRDLNFPAPNGDSLISHCRRPIGRAFSEILHGERKVKQEIKPISLLFRSFRAREIQGRWQSMTSSLFATAMTGDLT